MEVWIQVSARDVSMIFAMGGSRGRNSLLDCLCWLGWVGLEGEHTAGVEATSLVSRSDLLPGDHQWRMVCLLWFEGRRVRDWGRAVCDRD